jgi:hypothetical protein
MSSEVVLMPESHDVRMGAEAAVPDPHAVFGTEAGGDQGVRNAVDCEGG